MPGFLDDFMKSYGPEVSKQLAGQLGIKNNVAQQIIPQVVPMILGGLKRQMEQQGGAPRVDHILNKYGSANVLENIAGLFSQKAKDANPDPKLGGLLGDSGVQATELLSNKFGLNLSTAMKIIPMLTPLILGALTKKRDAGGVGSSGIAALLDQDGDGSILDDVAGMLFKGVMGGGSGSTGAGNILGGLLGGLLGKKK
jgi:hypothetical protein